MINKLPYDYFLKTFEYAPRAAINLLVIDTKRQILLTKRANTPFVNTWHIPGSFLLKGEKISDCLLRIAKKELGVDIDWDKAKLLGVFEDIDKDPRGHVIDIVYSYSAEGLDPKEVGDTKEIKFFSNLPPNIGFNHKETLSKLGW